MPYKYIKTGNNFMLSLCVAALAVLCFLSVYSPIRFQEERQRREMTVQKRMKAILQAERAYLHQHHTYTGNLQDLVAEGLLPDSLQYIPYAQRRKFDVQATMQLTKSGRQVPQVLCRAGYEDYLRGLDRDRIANLMEEAAEKGVFPGLETSD